MNTCDIIIPTYNGNEKLPLVISALIAQEVPTGWSLRLLLVDDGSRTRVESSMFEHTWADPWKAPVILRSSHKGRSHARNIAINHAMANVLLFLADDIIVRPGALREHLLFHEAHPEDTAAALGSILWDPRIRPTPFMDWMMHGGQQNDYDSILGASQCDGRHYFYGSFVSVKRKFLAEQRFSDHFSEYGWEDLELGRRLHTKGMVLYPLHRAMALHRHRYSADEILRRQRIVGSAKYLVNTNTSRRIVHGLYAVSGSRALVLYVMRKWGDSLNMPRFFAIATAGEFWYGVHHANRLLKSTAK